VFETRPSATPPAAARAIETYAAATLDHGQADLTAEGHVDVRICASVG
jgi:hypothetical protein